MLKIERDDYQTGCEHSSRAQCHAKGPSQTGWWWHNVPAWHVWDTEAGDYAAGTGPAQFARRRAADDWVRDHPPSGESR
jgi:hypothetical protein